MSASDQLMYKVAHYYYVDGLSQVEISDRLSLSRPKISRLLAQAKEEKIVMIELRPPASMETEKLKEDIRERFGIENVYVTPTIYDEPLKRLTHAMELATPYFQKFIPDGGRIGIAWGQTLLLMSRFLQTLRFSTSTSLIQIAGNLDNGDTNSYASEIISGFSQKLGIDSPNTLPCPIIVENSIIVDLLMHDRKIGNLFSQMPTVDIAFPNIGTLSIDSCLYKTGYLSIEQLKALRDKGAVGNVCCRFIDAQGRVVDDDLDKRTLSMSLDVLRGIRYSCACIASEEKVPALLSCLHSRLVNVLAIYSQAASALMACAT